ncbi:hypothetical protein DSM25559_5439 [Agrobacterium rosae]|uniref:Uncharacterized protein n=1 Tax=Agrobacterium rosae TaxID=1972867 RepID=A0A1R3U3M5_9HYPH|nr:hypothetical protein DSM25559_5439 [Agrobacterium rosae]
MPLRHTVNNALFLRISDHKPRSVGRVCSYEICDGIKIGAARVHIQSTDPHEMVIVNDCDVAAYS